MVSVLDSQSSGPWFKFFSGHLLEIIVLGRPKFKSAAILVNSQVAAAYQSGFLILLCSVELFDFKLFDWSACKVYE